MPVTLVNVQKLSSQCLYVEEKLVVVGVLLPSIGESETGLFDCAANKVWWGKPGQTLAWLGVDPLGLEHPTAKSISG